MYETHLNIKNKIKDDKEKEIILTSYAGNKTVAACSRPARTLGLMATCRAHRTLGTRGRLAHRPTGLTEEIAGLVVATIIINAAFHVHTGHQRAALQAGRADTARRVKLYAAFGAPSTRRRGG